ncbi:uncharacterized protein LOC123007095 [Tribolium madens]|uniref:uncharacterized protein LOC123007095 n=1 Tax=Tribolium madens TaxID=41895 RepID=UPI001CF76335|nr:uncharacterized protein LOC123007095 [Tribolium madens]XP_044258070.1 uncharacterized protein LOC123007095 [Tribolium madens]XP_044258071.1 uncharacterized protein LOC123007095 [Tribolium madens]XP_044258072.1 uncharacterized protein LOC123007095 [Tribolium madens]XP_044258074.1 uncharacterized protein LOC123007095 [Tribolium madens]
MAFICMIALALALVSTTAWSSHPFESAQDQYEAREDRPQRQLLTEATDHRPGVPMPQQSDNSKLPVQENNKRKNVRKRSYYPWQNEVTYEVPYQSITVWKPPVYQISRPYYIPIFGVPGRVPIYYPPQPFVNPGVPKDNKKPFVGPTYLPPETTTMSIRDRFNGGDNYDDRPIWADENGKTTETSVVPTRKPRPSRPRTPPPLVHNPTDPEENAKESETPTTVSTPVFRPNEPSRCVWAIISCCSSTAEVSYDCFEQRGCPGAFWDQSPCDNDFAQAAIAAALNYYNKK